MSEFNLKHPKVQDLINTSMNQGEYVATSRATKWLDERICHEHRTNDKCEHDVCANNQELISYLNRIFMNKSQND